jgi:hypothetical protein
LKDSLTEQNAFAERLQLMQEALQDLLADTRHISTQLDAASGVTDSLIKQVNSLSINYEVLVTGMGSHSSDASAKQMLSKTFLTLASLVVTILAVCQIYMFVSMSKIQRLQNEAGSVVMGNISGLNKKMASYDQNLTKALGKPEHVAQNQAIVEKPGADAHGNNEVGAVNLASVSEKLNKLRNGLPEKRLIRKETGDWFVYSKKTDECVSDIEIIEALNQAYKKIGRTISPTLPMPVHNSLCILKPDGKGGTEIVMTKEFLPAK